MARSAFDPATSGISWNGFADGKAIGAPGAVKIDNTANPYAAMASEMVGELAMNAGKEYMAPEGEWNEALGKWVYTKKPYSSMFGSYEIPGDAVWSDQVPVLMKELEIAEKKKAEAEKNAFIAKSAFDNQKKMETEAYGGMRGSDWRFTPLPPTPEEVVKSQEKETAISADDAGGATVKVTPYTQGLSDNNYLNAWTDRDRLDDPNKTGVSNWWENTKSSNHKDNAFDYVQDMLEDGVGSSEWNLSSKDEKADDMMDEVRHWMGTPNNPLPTWIAGPFGDSVNSPAWKHFNEHPEEWAEFAKAPVKWFFTNKEKYNLEVQTGIASGLLWDDWYSQQVADGKYDAVKISETFD